MANPVLLKLMPKVPERGKIRMNISDYFIETIANIVAVATKYKQQLDIIGNLSRVFVLYKYKYNISLCQIFE